jgi:uncharacterized protein YjbI with pentapeptide repeats
MDDSAVELRSRWSEPAFAERRSALIAGRTVRDDDDWRGVDLRGARIGGGLGRGARLDYAQLDGARLLDLDLHDAALSHASAVESSWTNVRMIGANLSHSNFAGAVLPEVALSQAVLVGATFAGADLRAAMLDGADLRECDLEGAWLWGSTRPRAGAAASSARAHARDAGYETFADILDDGGYLQLMHFTGPLQARAVEGLAWGSRALDAEVQAALRYQGWRPQLVAAAVALLGADRLRQTPLVCRALWDAVDRGSWASPQLVVACRLLDPEFERQARARLRGKQDDKPKHALAAMLGESSQHEGAEIASHWRARVEQWATSAAREHWREASP